MTQPLPPLALDQDISCVGINMYYSDGLSLTGGMFHPTLLQPIQGEAPESNGLPNIYSRWGATFCHHLDDTKWGFSGEDLQTLQQMAPQLSTPKEAWLSCNQGILE